LLIKDTLLKASSYHYDTIYMQNIPRIPVDNYAIPPKVRPSGANVSVLGATRNRLWGDKKKNSVQKHKKPDEFACWRIVRR
jgi:hypothetical protein